ncbi:alpha-acetolactate decarboxylase [Thozetella sp. PMI_491]|nr:alpha-acetolactate decarboxylase [Thozetella sp. PMI_491]
MATNELFQFSMMASLMAGVASTGIPFSTLLSHGNHGVGTFRNIAGELIILDGKVYQMRSDGTVATLESKQDLEQISPFATVTRFKATATVTAAVPDKQGLSNLVGQLLPKAANHFVAIRVDGAFKSITVRTAGGQRYPHESLTEVGKEQVEHKFESARGTIIGFRLPPYMANISVVGEHMHFIAEDRKHGGHVLAVESDGDVVISVAKISKLHLNLPVDDDDFDTAILTGHEAGIAAVEG